MAEHAAMDDLDRGRAPANGLGGTSTRVTPANVVYGPLCAPTDLLEFVAAQSVRDASLALNLARGTVHRLRQGYWPLDPRKIVRAWSAYKGRTAVAASSWFLRRVRAGGVVHHAGMNYTAPRLATRTGELLAVARTQGGELMAQTLELPTQRMALARHVI